MNYQFSKDSTNQTNDQRKPSGARKKTVYDFTAFKFSYDTNKDNIIDDPISIVSKRNAIENAEHFPSQVQGQSPSFQQQNMSRDLYYNSVEPFKDNTQTQQKRQTLLQRSEQPEKQLFYQQKIHKPEPRVVLEIRQCLNDECSKPPEYVKEEEDEAVVSEQQPVYQPFTETFRDMTINDLIGLCEDHVGVINTCNMLQTIITEELMKQVKLDDIVCQKLTARAQRLQQQTVFLEKVQAPNWVKAALDDLVTRATQRAQAYKTHAAHLLEQCQTVQCSMDETVEAVKATAAATAADRSQETKDDEETRNETSLVSTQTSKTTDDVVDKHRSQSFLQIHGTFEAVRKPWMKLLSLLEYQQEQYNATLMQMEQAENEIEQLVNSEEVDSSPWRTQMKKKNLETKKELLEARREHLETDMSNAKKEISEFELSNRDNIMDVLNALRQQRNRCDSVLRDNFQLLLNASLRDPTCFRHHVNQPEPRTEDVEASNNRQTSFDERLLHESWRFMNSSEHRQNPFQMCGDASCDQGTTCTSLKNQEFSQTKNSIAANVPNSADFISKPPLRDFKGSRFQNQRPLYSYMLLSDSESAMGDKTDVEDISPLDSMKGRYVNAKQDYRTEGYKSPSDFNYSRAVKDPQVSTADEGICDDRMDGSGSPVGYDDSKTTSWSVSSSQAEHKQFKSSVFADDNAEKTSPMAKEDHDKSPYTVQRPSLYQDICGREYNSQRFQVGVTEQANCVDPFEEDLARSQKYLRSAITAPTPDVLSNKEVRAAYFINKYAGGRHSDRTFLLKNMHGMRPLAWRGTKDFSIKKLGRGCHGNGSKKNRDGLARLGSSKRKIDSKTMKENAAGLEEVESFGCPDSYSDSSVADDDNVDLQNTNLEHPK